MLHWIAAWIAQMSYGAVALLMAIENVFLPLPSELIMPLAGLATVHGRMTLPGVIAAGTIGGVVGSLPFYFLARLGNERLRRAVNENGRWLFLRPADVYAAMRHFERRGGWSVFISRMLPAIRGLIAIPAGLARMSFPLFLLANFAGTLIWCAVLASLGRLLRWQFTRVQEALGPVGWVLSGVAMLVGVVWWLRRRRRAAPWTRRA